MRAHPLLCVAALLSLAGCDQALDQQYKKAMDESGEQKVLQAEVIEAHKTSIRHKDSIMKSSECGCFHCLAIFPPLKITDWTDINSAINK